MMGDMESNGGGPLGQVRRIRKSYVTVAWLLSLTLGTFLNFLAINMNRGNILIVQGEVEGLLDVIGNNILLIVRLYEMMDG